MSRRVLMMGSLVLVPGLPARAVVGCTWSLAFASLYVLVQPYTTTQLNGLSAAAVWLVVCVYAGGVMVVCRPCGYNDVALGMILLLFSLALISWALFLQFERIQRDGNIVAVLEGRSRGFALTHDGTSSQFQPEQAPGISSSTAVQRVSSITAAIRTSLKSCASRAVPSRTRCTLCLILVRFKKCGKPRPLRIRRLLFAS